MDLVLQIPIPLEVGHVEEAILSLQKHCQDKYTTPLTVLLL